MLLGPQVRYARKPMTPEEAIHRAQAAQLAPIYLVVGQEDYLAGRVLSALRAGSLANGVAEFNEDRFVAGEVDVDRVISAARMAPMMAQRRFVVVHGVERWDARSGDDDEGAAPPATTHEKGMPPLDRLAQYATAPADRTCLVLRATKIDGRRKIMAAAKKGDFLINCEALSRSALPTWIAREAKAKGNTISAEMADLLAELAGPELASVADALERVSLFVGPSEAISEEAISACVIRMRQSTVWEMVGAVGKRDLGRALSALADVYDPRDHGLRLVGVLAWSIRQLIRFEAALRGGARPDQAAERAGAPSFRARELSQQLQNLGPRELERWLMLLAQTDLDLKGSKRPARSIVEDTIVQMCCRRAG